MRVLIINTPCNGFGDIIFAWKIAKYLRDWYSHIQVYIATTLPESLITLGENPDWVLRLKPNSETYKQCRRLSRLKLLNLDNTKVDNSLYDIYLVTPLQSDFLVNRSDIRSLFKNSNKKNTFYFSEYNDEPNKCDFNTGIGHERLGLLFTNSKGKCNLESYNLRKNNYAILYIAKSINDYVECYESFFELICKKYSISNTNFHVVCPEWVAIDIVKNSDLYIFYKYFKGIVIITKTKKYEFMDGKGRGIIYIRGEILPVPNEVMIGLIKYSVRDILLTGDQSITDALSCCPKKNIFYQIASWKEELSRNLAKQMPNKYLLSKKTSCGTLNAINHRSDYTKFCKKWDFRKLGKPLLDKIFLTSRRSVKKHIRK